MKIGIIVHSKTGHTLSVAQKLHEDLISKGHEVELIKLEIGKNESGKEEFVSQPEISGYEGIIFGSHVEAFSLPVIMKNYLNGITGLSGKNVGIILTQQFKYKWMGGNHTANQMEKILRDKNARVMGAFIINWSSSKKQEQIDDCLEKMILGF